ncbi:MAG TPA: hypothetical protein DDY70_02550 [Clostridiales bacterium]|nr:hypothetical protein [Clostridiales bacterium]
MPTEETVFSADKVTTENLAALHRRAHMTSDARIAELSFLAGRTTNRALELLGDGMDLYEILSLIPEGIPLSDEGAAGVGRAGARAAYEMAYDRAVFTDLCLEKLAERGISPTESDFLPTGNPPETFTYVRNAYADEAYDVFSTEFSDPRVKYSHTFAEAVKSVLDGECGYCLLPLAEKGGVRLSSVTDLLAKNDLKIASVTPVFGFSGDAELWYALVSRTFRVPKVAGEDDRYLEIRCSEEGEGTLADLLTAARVFGATLYRVHTVTRRMSGEDGFYYTVVFRTEGKSFAGLLAYLTMYTETYVPVGIYKNLE